MYHSTAYHRYYYYRLRGISEHTKSDAGLFYKRSPIGAMKMYFIILK